MTNPKCPDCGERLIKIPCTDREYICANDDCPANVEDRKKGYIGHIEYYGTQEEINKQKRIKFKV